MSATRIVFTLIASAIVSLSTETAFGQGAEMEFDHDVKYNVIIQVTDYDVEPKVGS